MGDDTKIPSGSISIKQRGVNAEDVRPNNENSVSLVPIRGVQIEITLSADGNAIPVKKLTVTTGDSSSFTYR